MFLDNVNVSEAASYDPNQHRPLPPSDAGRWSGQVETMRDPYVTETESNKTGFRRPAHNVRDDKSDGDL